MRQRTITGTILTIVLAVLIYFGEGELELLFSGFCVLLAGFASYEFVKMSRHGKETRWFDYTPVVGSVLFSLASVMYLFSLVSLNVIGDFYKYMFVFILILILINTVLFVSIKEYSRIDFGNQLFTVLYCSLGFIAFAFLRKLDINLILYLLIVSMITDVFAYLIGVKFGKHKLAPEISPKKSVEGSIGGLVFGAAAATIFAYFTNLFDLSLFVIILMSLGLSAIAQIGDLVASKFKREVGIKDYSNILPGHGGILDRFDSSMFAAIFLMLFVILF
ncbi:MAG: phosphatidate cytidylyltransferase [Tenericutes bacterium]|nr:phosphatidate cytidylyltransferase [Mycoplasmatota bacterium]